MGDSRLGLVRQLPALLCGLLAMCGAWAAGEIADLHVASHQLSWTPRVASDVLSLTVSGETVYREQRFAAGEQPMLDTLATDGTTLPDGVYTWELRVIPDITPTAADKAAGLVGSWPAETQSGQFVIHEGQLLTSTDKEE